MSSSIRALAPVVALALTWAVPVAAEAPAAPSAEAPAAEPAVPSAPQAAGVEEDAATEEPPAAGASEPAGGPDAAEAARAEEHVVTLGPVGQDDGGRVGRIHTVARGDTLWDISDAYLGTPWVWPSIWSENAEVTNPHLIFPGDRLWITPGEIRRVSDAEAEEMLAAAPADGGAASIDAVPVEGAALSEGDAGPPSVRVAIREEVGLVSDQRLEGAASVVDSPIERTWIGSMDDVFLGLGSGGVEPGEQFVVFRARERVYDPSTGRPLGWNVNVLGWVEVKEVHEEVALAEVRMAYGEMRVGDRVLPRERVPEEIELRPTPEGVDGQVVLMADNRLNNGTDDIVYLDRGTRHGLEVGSLLEVYRSVGEVDEPVRGESVRVPARIVGTLVVVSALPDSASAIVRRATQEIEIGDRVRSTGL